MTTQHETISGARVVQSYDVDTLGAPFEVTLLESVTVSVDPSTGQELVEIPDPVGLISAVVRARATHPRKLNGPEIKFFRHALGVKAKSLAQFLDMSPEHLSRCEGGTKVMSPASERMFRLYVFLATHMKDPEALLERPGTMEPKTAASTKVADLAKNFLRWFLSLKIQTVFDPDEKLHFEFVRRDRRPQISGPDGEPDDDGDDGLWADQNALAA